MGGAVGRLALRIHEGAVCGVDSFPARACRVLRVVRIGRVVICKDLELAPNKADSSLPFPHVAVQIPDTGHGLVVAPRDRAGTGCDSCDLAAFVVGRHGLVIAFAAIFTVVVVTIREEAVLLAPESDRGPFRVSAQVPACALGLAACACAVEVDTCGRIFARQAVRYGVVNLGLILAVVKAGNFHAVDNEGRVGAVISAGEHVRVLKLRDIHQNGREIGVVCLDDVVRADHFYCQICEVKICHFLVLLSAYSMLQRISFTSAMSSGFFVRSTVWRLVSPDSSAPSSGSIGVSV